jgi:hypothetical protein
MIFLKRRPLIPLLLICLILFLNECKEALARAQLLNNPLLNNPYLSTQGVGVGLAGGGISGSWAAGRMPGSLAGGGLPGSLAGGLAGNPMAPTGGYSMQLSSRYSLQDSQPPGGSHLLFSQMMNQGIPAPQPGSGMATALNPNLPSSASSPTQPESLIQQREISSRRAEFSPTADTTAFQGRGFTTGAASLPYPLQGDSVPSGDSVPASISNPAVASLPAARRQADQPSSSENSGDYYEHIRSDNAKLLYGKWLGAFTGQKMLSQIVVENSKL